MSYKNIEDGAGDAGDGHAAGTNGVQVESLSLLQRVRKMIPDTVNLDVLDLSISQPPRERFYLLTKYMQPWGEFFDISEYNLPIMAEYQTRLYANFGAFFYNYFLIGCIFDLAYLLLNFVSVLVLVCCTGVVFSLHRLDPDGVENETLSTALKFGRYPVMILCGVFAVTHGRLLMLVLSTLFFAGIVAVHAFIREHET